ncbi:MAG: tetrahydromethanopterin S-methyltransferase subunit A [bacterium]
MMKVKPPPDYPTETGCYLRGNDFSPVAVVVLLNAPMPLAHHPDTKDIKIPPAIEILVQTAVETGAALAGTLQTENIGIEKIICNVVGNSNIRYLVLCGEEVEGHSTGDALRALMNNGINDRRTIIGTEAPTPYLFNILLTAIERFRNQITLIDLLGEMKPEVISNAVWSCYQEPEKPVQFRDLTLFDPGAYPEPAISCRLTGMVPHPEEVEEWEVEEIMKNIEKDKPPARRGDESVRELVPEKKSKANDFIAERLTRIAQELLDVAGLLSQPVEMPAGEPQAAGPVKDAISPPVVEVEEDEVSLHFTNQLRGYNAVFAVYDALNGDICGPGRSLPVSVNRAIKKLKKLKQELKKSPIPPDKKGEIASRIDDFLRRTEELPTDPGPCQKTDGDCKIGPGCFATAALDMLKLVTEPER